MHRKIDPVKINLLHQMHFNINQWNDEQELCFIFDTFFSLHCMEENIKENKTYKIDEKDSQ